MRAAIGRGVALATAIFGLVGLSAGLTAAVEPIKIGTFLSVTGPASFLGDPELRTLRIYIAEMNKGGGVLGRRIELVEYDVGLDSGKAKAAVKRLIENDKVDVIIGGSTTWTTLAVVAMVEHAGIPFISLARSVAIIDPVRKWVFKTPHTDRLACAKIFADMVKRGIKKIAMISGGGGFGKSMRGQCMALAPAYGIAIVADETYGRTDTDMTPQLRKIMTVAGVEAVINPGFGEGPAIVARNRRQLAISVPFYQSHGVASKRHIELAGGAANGIRFPASALIVADLLAPGDPQRPVVIGYKTIYEKSTGTAASIFGGHAYDGLQLALAAMARAGSTDKEKV